LSLLVVTDARVSIKSCIPLKVLNYVVGNGSPAILFQKSVNTSERGWVYSYPSKNF